MRQRALTIVVPLRTDASVDALRTTLRTQGGGWQGEANGPFAAVDGLHYLACCVVESDGAEPALVVLELDFDGRAKPFLSGLVERCRAELDRIFGSCEGYPQDETDPEAIVRFLRKHDQGANTFYLGHPGRSVAQIRKEEKLHQRLRGVVGAAPRTTRAELWKALRAARPPEKSPRLPFLVRYSLLGWRGPRRAGEILGVLLRALVAVAGVAAFASLALTAATAPGGRSRAIVVGVVVAALVAIGCASRLRPKHLSAKGDRLALCAALWQGARVFGYLAVLAGVLAALFPEPGGPWMPLPRWEALAAAVPSALGLALVLALLVATTATAWLVSEWPGGVLVAVGVLGIGALGYAEYASNGLTEILLVVGPAVLWLSFALAVVVAAALLLPPIRRRERDDTVAPARWNLDHLARMTEHEDHRFQNHFASVTTVKDDLRLWQLRVVLRLVQLLARILFNQGTLGSIPSIHCARFVILNERGRDRKRLLFLTNYDGGWPNYLGEFSHVVGVTLVWGSTELFPRPFLVGDDGARDEQRFKTWARNSQIETLIWYSAYPDLSVAQVNRNTRLRQSLDRRLERDAPRLGPLLPIWRAWRRPLGEAAVDQALRSLTR